MPVLDTIYNALSNRGRQIKQAVNNIVNSPEAQFIRDTWQLQQMAQVNADNNIGPAWENVVYNLNRYKRSSPAWWDRWVAADALDDSVARYNEALKAYWNNTTWWPKNNEWEFRWQDYVRYRDYGTPYQYAYTTEGEKANAILSWWRYEPQKFEFQTQSWANLIRQMRELTSQYNKLEELQKVVWPQRNALKEQWKWDTKEARQYLDQWAEYDKEKTNILNALRQAKDNYYNLVNSYKK